MKKEYRLLKNEDFKKVLDFKRNVSRENFTIYQRNNELNHIRVGVSVSSKIGNSVVRHKIKRQVTNMLNKHLNLNLKYDIVIIVRKKYLEKSFQQNSNDLNSALLKLIGGIKNEK